MRPEALVVGVDGSPAADAALAFAVRDGAASNRRVRAVTAWWAGEAGYEERRLERHMAERILDRAIDRVLRRSVSRVFVERDLAHGHPGDVLVRHARHEYALVLGRNDDGDTGGSEEDSVTASCIRGSAIPVVLVPAVQSRDRVVDDIEVASAARERATELDPMLARVRR